MTKFGDLLNEPVFKENGMVRVKCKYRRQYSKVDNNKLFNCATVPELCPSRLFNITCDYYELEIDYIDYIKYNNIDTSIRIIR